MGAAFLPVLLFSVLWGVVGVVLPFFVPGGPHKSVIQVRSNIHPEPWIQCFIFSAGCSDDHGRLLLAVLAMLLHEPDEPSDRPGLGDQGSHRHEE